MSSKRPVEDKAEAYTRALLDAARQEGRANADLVQWQHAKKFSPEVLETLSAMQAEDDASLIDQVAKRYKELLDSEDKTVSVTVTTAVPMGDQLRDKVRAQAEKRPSILSSALIPASWAAFFSRRAASAWMPRCVPSSRTLGRRSPQHLSEVKSSDRERAGYHRLVD